MGDYAMRKIEEICSDDFRPAMKNLEIELPSNHDGKVILALIHDLYITIIQLESRIQELEMEKRNA
jgi:hypothetical protein